MKKLLKSIILTSLLLMMSNISFASDQDLEAKYDLKQSIKSDKELLSTIKYIEELRDKAITKRYKSLAKLGVVSLAGLGAFNLLAHADPKRKVLKALRILGLYTFAYSSFEARDYYISIGEDLQILNDRLAQKKEELKNNIEDNQYLLACID